MNTESKGSVPVAMWARVALLALLLYSDAVTVSPVCLESRAEDGVKPFLVTKRSSNLRESRRQPPLRPSHRSSRWRGP